jgi:hypothetical protein
MEAARDAMVRATDRDLDQLLPDYVFVRLADLISLTFCVGWDDEQRFGGWAVQRLGTRVVVAPDAFGGTETPIEIDAREIVRRTFRSDAELRAALSEAKNVTLTGVLSGFTR